MKVLLTYLSYFRKYSITAQLRKKHSNCCTHSNFPANLRFDRDCKRQKRIVNGLAAHLSKNPSDALLRSTLLQEKAGYKNLTRRKKRSSIKEFHLKLQNLRKCKPKDFWRIINSYSDSKSNDIPVSTDRLFFHFKHLNKPNSHSSGSTPQTSEVITNETIDFPITEEEVANSIRLLKPSKSPGIDNIPPRVYKVLNQQ